MPELTFIPATTEHAKALAATMRPEGVAELLASCGAAPLEALTDSMRISSKCWAALADGEVAALFGVVPFERPGEGCVWMITGTVFLRHARHFVKVGRSILRELLAETAQLENYIDARYTEALTFARWLGFDIGPPEPRGPYGLQFHPVVVRGR